MFADAIANYFIKLVIDTKHYVWFPVESLTADEATQYWNMTAYKIMVKDKSRMATYQKAIEEQVKDKEVLEIGTGALAPLARMSVKAGAKKVYAIEANNKAAQTARKVLKEEGADEKVELFSKFSYDVELPEKAEVLVQELVGHMGCDEGMARIVHDAKQRLLKKEAAFIPKNCSVDIAPVGHKISGNPPLIAILRFVCINVLKLFCWKKQNEFARFYIWNFPERDFLGAPLEYENKEFATDFPLEESRKLEFSVSREGEFSGFLLWNKIEVAKDSVINCLRGTHWPATYLPVCRKPMKVQPGDTILLETYQDLRVNPTYKFETSIIREGEKTTLGCIKC